jgi:hypothetical protein
MKGMRENNGTIDLIAQNAEPPSFYVNARSKRTYKMRMIRTKIEGSCPSKRIKR